MAVNWCVKGLIPENQTTLLAGYPGQGKSWVIDQLAVCFASGASRFLDEFETDTGSVILIDEDTPTDVLNSRLERLHKFYGLKYGNLSNLVVKSMTGFQLSNNIDLNNLISNIYGLNDPVLVILDSLSKVCGEYNLNRTLEATKTTSRWSQIRSTGATLVVNHHVSLKQEVDYTDDSFLSKVMGNTQLIAGCDSALGIWKFESPKPSSKFIIRPEARRVTLSVKNPFCISLNEDINQTWAHMTISDMPDLSPSTLAKRIAPVFTKDGYRNMSVAKIRELIKDHMTHQELLDALRELDKNEVIVRNEAGGSSHRFEYSVNPDFNNANAPTNDYWDELR